MLTRVRPQVVRPWIGRPRGVAFAVALFAALSASSAFAQCRGGAGGMGGSGGAGGVAGSAGASLAGAGTAIGAFAATGPRQAGLNQSGNGFFALPTEQMMQPAFPPIVDDNRQYVAERRALRAAKAEQARQRLAARKEKPARHRAVAVNATQESL